MRERILVLGDGLFDGLPGLPEGTPVLMLEDRELCTRVRHHRQKLVLYLSSMRRFRDRLRAEGREVEYVELNETGDETFLDRLSERLDGVDRLHVHRINDAYLRDGLRARADDLGVELVEAESPMFVTSPDDWAAYRKRRKRLRMSEFYQDQRLRLGLLVENGKPTGGQWSFDPENRKALPKSENPPALWTPDPGETVKEVIALVDRVFPKHYGSAKDFRYPTSHEEAREWLDEFLQIRLDKFGHYEDSLSVRERTVYHGLLTPMLNTGLLTPEEVVERTLERHAVTPVPLNSLEGFLRQIVGWREFMRYVGEEMPEPEDAPNPLGNRRTLKECWWTAETGLPPLDLVIRRALDHAYAHHIERLMVVGSAMMMCEVSPRASYDWFMELFIDSADWVMLPNAVGMSQFGVGGMFTTKPYLSGSAYLLRMGDYAPGPWTDVWDGLFWRFVGKHRDLFEANPRTKAMTRNLDRMAPDKLARLTAEAERFIDRVTSPPAR